MNTTVLPFVAPQKIAVSRPEGLIAKLLRIVLGDDQPSRLQSDDLVQVEEPEWFESALWTAW